MAGKKLTLTISQEAYDELEELTKQRGDTISQAFQIGLSLYKVVAKAECEGQKLFVASSDDQSEQEVVVPRGAAAS